MEAPTESFPMNGGTDRYSYVKNSTLQKYAGVDLSKRILEEAIAENLDIQNLPFPNTFRIVDLGCSVGPNTFIAVQNIIQAIDLKFKSQGGLLSDDISCSENLPEFHVFFSDHTSNDFNTLFASLPPKRRYFAAGVPGSFYTNLFPQGSLHFVHSSFALQWLSRVPKEVVDLNSSAWNKGRIHYGNAPNEVLEAYSAQYVKDMEAFLRARAQEIVYGGLMVISVPAMEDETPPSLNPPIMLFNLLGSCLMDMAKVGDMVDEAKVDSFNLPIYITSPREVEALVKKNGCFSVERLEALTPELCFDTQILSDNIRAAMEGLIKQHFGTQIILLLDQLFDRYSKKLAESLDVLKSGKSIQLFLLLKRNANIAQLTN